MNDDDFRAFSSLTKEEKIENFEESTLSLILVRLNWSPKELNEVKPVLTADWFTHHVLHNDFELIITRFFSFNIQDFLDRPRKSAPIVEALSRVEKNNSPFAMIFKAPGGRLVIDNMTSLNKDYINIAVPRLNTSLKIYKFQDYERFEPYVRDR